MSYDLFSKRLAYDDSSNLVYFAVNTIDGIDESLPTWLISKLVYSGGNLSYVEGPIMGAWDNRTLLDWS